jgi:hypothetical protein
VTLESRNHVLLPHDPAWGRFVSELRGFLAEERTRRPLLSPERGALSS